MIGRSGAPSWIGAGVQRLRGEMASAQTRLEMVRARSAPLLAHQTLDDKIMHQVVADLWLVVDTYLRIGQMVSAPRLLPGARPLPPLRPVRPAPPIQADLPPLRPVPAPPPSPPMNAGIPPSVPVNRLFRPPAPPLDDPIRPIPAIEPSWHQGSPDAQTAQPSEPSRPPDNSANRDHLAHDRALPRIDVASQTSPAQPTSKCHISEPATSRALPDIVVPARTEHSQVRQLPEIIVPAHSTRDTAAPTVAQSSGSRQSPASPVSGDRHVEFAERWLLTTRATRHQLRAAGQEEQAERALATFWEAKRWTLSAQEQAYLDAVAALLATAAVTASGRHLPACPFAPIYQVSGRDIQMLGHTLPAHSVFSYDYRAGYQTLQSGLTPADGVSDEG